MDGSFAKGLRQVLCQNKFAGLSPAAQKDFKSGRAVDPNFGAGLFLRDLREFAVKVGPLHLEAIAQTLARADSEFEDSALDLRLVPDAKPLDGV